MPTREKIGEQIGIIPVGREGNIKLYLTRRREGTQGNVVDEYELWVGDTLLAIIRDHLEYSLEEVPLELLSPMQPS